MSEMKTIDVEKENSADLYKLLVTAVGPRPIAFVSTIDKDGNSNLSPYSFFNVFGSNPPTLIFGPCVRRNDLSQKDALYNVQEVAEVVVHMVDFPLVEQMYLASTEYDRGVNEFEKAGLTEVASDKVRPSRVKEAVIAFECKVQQVLPLGNEGGACNLVICEIVQAHFDQSILQENGLVDPFKMDHVGRLGEAYYTRITPESIFKLLRPRDGQAIGVDQLPEEIRGMEELTGNELGRLGNVSKVPENQEVADFVKEHHMKDAAGEMINPKAYFIEKARDFLREGETESALKTLLSIAHVM